MIISNWLIDIAVFCIIPAKKSFASVVTVIVVNRIAIFNPCLID